MWLRSVLGLVMLWPLIHSAGGIQAMKTLRLPQHVARNGVHYAAQYGWFVALTLIPLAPVVALEFTMPIWSAALAVAFLGERMNRWKVLAVALGLAGVAVIVRPAATGLNPGQLVALAAAVGWAVYAERVDLFTALGVALILGGNLPNLRRAPAVR
jgi:drug/metabolite transporter (DMT)-like permease